MKEKKIEIGDEVICRGEVIWIDDDGTPRVSFHGSQCPIRISVSAFELISKPAKPPKPKVKVKPIVDWPD
ncbi:hypothetical protein CO661_24020 [Sinorhizobium fredii]|uniref:Uncharacterized protein n=1 Tax=Rhizobium fredii TaxID=380 RepID=A0A2A6LRV7_RHIFR|nr:hypothetical protein [Sinorhizobium fredii]PDT45334.1 hypothetical protein CO661_24020 [Sinorhizobium fredii]